MRLVLFVGILFFAACGEKSKPAAIPATPEQQQNDSTVNDSFDWNDEDGTSLSVASTCSYERRKEDDQCQELRLRIKAADATTNRVSSRINGRADEPVALAFTVEASSSRYEDAVRDTDRLLFGFRDIPRDADTQIDGLTAALLHVPERVGTEKYEAVVRDVGRCLVEYAYNSKGDEDEDKAAQCEDLEEDDDDLRKFEETETVTATIEKSSKDEQKDAALSQIDAACKANMMTGIIGAVPALFSGNAGSAILGVGTSTFTNQIQCDAQKQQIESQFGLNQPL